MSTAPNHTKSQTQSQTHIDTLTSQLKQLKEDHARQIQEFEDKIKQAYADLIKELRDNHPIIYTIRASVGSSHYNDGIYDIAYFSTAEKALSNLILKEYTSRRGRITTYSVGVSPVSEIGNTELLNIDVPLPYRYQNRAKKHALRNQISSD